MLFLRAMTHLMSEADSDSPQLEVDARWFWLFLPQVGATTGDEAMTCPL